MNQCCVEGCTAEVVNDDLCETHLAEAYNVPYVMGDSAFAGSAHEVELWKGGYGQ